MKITGSYGGFPVGDEYDVLITGVLNISPESFYKESTAVNREQVAAKTHQMLQEGAKVIDVGGKSTRPLSLYGGSKPPTEEDELQRVQNVLPSIIEVCEQESAKVSIDTQSALVAEYALEQGAAIVNDISGLQQDTRMAQVVADAHADLVIMPCVKLPGDPTTFTASVDALTISVKIAKSAGIENICIDPGFGGWHGRGSATDLDLLQHYTELRELGLPIYAGVSRKSTIQTIGGANDPNDRLLGSILLTNWLVDRGTHIIRTHDVYATLEGLQVHKFLQRY